MRTLVYTPWVSDSRALYERVSVRYLVCDGWVAPGLLSERRFWQGAKIVRPW